MAAKIRRALWAWVLLLLILSLLLSISSCGRKKWPSPQAGEEAFSWESVQAQRHQECLQIKARLQGKSKNLRNIILQLEGRQQPCPDCPFQPKQSIQLGISSQQVQKKDDQLQIEYCHLDSELHYRLRLLGLNAFTSLEPA
ncbi:MAG: hypothetical protein ACOC0S_02100, partial [Desulfohalobiaceae bacterium]